jgi:ankyrin repeat protein
MSDVAARDFFGRTPLFYAALENDVAEVRRLLAAGADPHVHERRRRYTPLHFAAQQDAVEAARLLLEAGANVNAPDSYGNPPLWTAIFSARERGDLIRLLLDAGADSHHRNTKGSTPLDVAKTLSPTALQFLADVDGADA